MNKTRLENFSDGVFAIAVTLLVLNIKIPDAHTLNSAGLNRALLAMVPHVLTFVFTFLVIGVFWVGHHRIFTFVRILDTGLLWLNIFYLMFVAVLPFPAAILSENPFLPTSIILYCVSLGIIASMHFLFMTYIFRHKDIKDDVLTHDVYMSGIKNAEIGPVTYLVAAGASFISVYISFVMILAVLVFYIFFAGRKLENRLIHERVEKGRK
jgi:uncharacterized membrane protein